MRQRANLTPVLALLTTWAVADPGFITGGGQPQLVSGKTSVRMTSEKVKLTMWADRVDVDGTFNFTNLGKSCTARIGFPESASFSLSGTKGSSVLAHYQSFVDGKKAATKLMKGKTMDEQWDVQWVSFAAKEKHTLHIQYSTSLGGMAGKPVAAMTEYILHTGGSWNGNIGKVDFDVEFTPQSELSQPFNVWHQPADKLTARVWASQINKTGGVIITGPGTVTELGNSIHLTASNLKPSKLDDILIIFKYPPKQLVRIMKPGATTPVVPPR